MNTIISHLISEDTRKEMAELKILINKYVKILPKVKQCKYCNNEIKYTRDGFGQGYIKNGFCDSWCQSQVIHTRKSKPHFCKHCNKQTFAPRNKQGHSTGVYPKYCKECIKVGNHKWRGGNKKTSLVIKSK